MWKEVFEKLGQSGKQFKDRETPDNENKVHRDEHLDQEITIEEVTRIMKDLANNKAAGVDGITNEMLKAGNEEMVRAVWILCRRAFELEKVPEEWVKGLIVPIYKDGDKNYRGITLLSVVGKIYTAVLNRRIMTVRDQQQIS